MRAERAGMTRFELHKDTQAGHARESRHRTPRLARDLAEHPPPALEGTGRDAAGKERRVQLKEKATETIMREESDGASLAWHVSASIAPLQLATRIESELEMPRNRALVRDVAERLSVATVRTQRRARAERAWERARAPTTTRGGRRRFVRSRLASASHKCSFVMVACSRHRSTQRVAR